MTISVFQLDEPGWARVAHNIVTCPISPSFGLEIGPKFFFNPLNLLLLFGIHRKKFLRRGCITIAVTNSVLPQSLLNDLSNTLEILAFGGSVNV